MHLWTVLDGKSAVNPVKDVPRYREITKPLRLPSLEDAEKAIQAVKVDKKRSKSRARLQVLLWTGWPAAQLMQLEHSDIHWQAKTARVTGRLKGRGTDARVLPLLPQAILALKAFKKAKAWGPFSTSSLHRTLRLACLKAKVRPFNPYALRHLNLTLLAAATKDDRFVAEMGMHSDVRQTRRYTESSVSQRLKDGIAAVAKHLVARATTSG